MGSHVEYSLFCPRCRRHYEAERTVCPSDGWKLLEVPLTLPRPGNVFDSRYVILETIGKGGMATIYRGYDVPNRRQCALKVLKVKFTSEERAVVQFFNEARMARRLRHPNIVRTYDYGRTEIGYLYIAMELLSGQTLSRLIRRGGALEPARALNLFAQMTDALAAAHDCGTIHRDLKPENIFLCREDDRETVKLLDFGIAQFAGVAASTSRDICGTPAYMSPEQIRGKQALPASDLYSAGILLFEMLSGVQAFTGASAMEILKRQLKMEPPMLSVVVPELAIDPRVEHLVNHLMQKRLSKRASSAAFVRRVLDRIMEQPCPAAEHDRAPAGDAGDPPGRETVTVFSYNSVEADLDQSAALGIVPVVSAEMECLLEQRVRPGIMLEEELSIRLAGEGEEAVNEDTAREESRQPTASMAERYSMIHVRFVALDTDIEDTARAEELRLELVEELEPWFDSVQQLGGLVCYDSGAELKVLFGYLTDSKDYAIAALDASRSLSLQMEYQAIRKGRPCGVQIGVATGVVYTDLNVEGPLDWLIKGSDIDFAVRLSRIAPVGGVVMCQNTAIRSQPSATVYEVAPVAARGGRKVQTFLLKSLVGLSVESSQDPAPVALAAQELESESLPV